MSLPWSHLAVLATKRPSAAFLGDAGFSRARGRGGVNLEGGDTRRAHGVAVTDETDRASTRRLL